MRNLVILFLLFLLTINLNAQIVNCGYNSNDFEQMMESTMMMVLTGKTEYDQKLLEAASNYWTVTPFDTISVGNLNSVIHDESRSFLLPILFSVTFDFDISKAGNEYTKLKSWISIINGGKKEIEKYSDNDAVAIAPISLYSDEAEFEHCAYRLEYVIKGLNDIIEIVKQKKLTGGPLKMPFKVMTQINKNKRAIRKKTLVINGDLKNVWGKEIISNDVFKKFYKYKYKIVSESEFSEILNSDSEEYLCLMPIFEVNKHTLIYETSSKKTIYYGWSMQGLTIKKKDIKKITEF